jgi:hypothetical protein
LTGFVLLRFSILLMLTGCCSGSAGYQGCVSHARHGPLLHHSKQVPLSAASQQPAPPATRSPTACMSHRNCHQCIASGPPPPAPRTTKLWLCGCTRVLLLFPRDITSRSSFMNVLGCQHPACFGPVYGGFANPPCPPQKGPCAADLSPLISLDLP